MQNIFIESTTCKNNAGTFFGQHGAGTRSRVQNARRDSRTSDIPQAWFNHSVKGMDPRLVKFTYSLKKGAAKMKFSGQGKDPFCPGCIPPMCTRPPSIADSDCKRNFQRTPRS